MSRPPVQTPSPAKVALLGGALCALLTVTLAQRHLDDVEASTSLTLLAVGGGFALGALISFVIAKIARR